MLQSVRSYRARSCTVVQLYPLCPGAPGPCPGLCLWPQWHTLLRDWHWACGAASCPSAAAGAQIAVAHWELVIFSSSIFKSSTSSWAGHFRPTLGPVSSVTHSLAVCLVPASAIATSIFTAANMAANSCALGALAACSRKMAGLRRFLRILPLGRFTHTAHSTHRHHTQQTPPPLLCATDPRVEAEDELI